MHKNGIYRAFLLTVGLIAIGYSSVTAYRYYKYSALTRDASPLSLQWAILEQAEDEYILQAAYTFRFQNDIFEGKTAWPKEFYRHRWAAEKDQDYFSKKYPVIWFDPLDPHHSTMHKVFPTRELVYSILLWAIFLYFLGLGFYVA